jgi:hypothetical protein
MANSVPFLLASHNSWLQDLSVSFHDLRALVGRLRGAPHEPQEEAKIDAIEKLAGEAEAQFASDLAAHGPRGDLLTSPTFAALVRVGRLLVDWMRPSWAPIPAPPHHLSAREPYRFVKAPLGDEKALSTAEEFIAGLLVCILREILRHFRHFFAILSGGSLLLVLTISVYAFEPKRFLLSIVLTTMLAFVVGGTFVYVSLDRDELLSRLSQGEPGKLGVNVPFLRWAFTWGVLPVTSALALRYPQALHAVGSWVSPFLGQ